MAAPTVVEVGADFLFKFGGTKIGGRRGGSLSLTTDIEDVTNADSNQWRKIMAHTESWSVSLDGLYLEGSTPAEESGFGTTFGTDDGIGGYDSLPGLRTVAISMSMETIDTTTQDSSQARSLLPNTRSVTITIEADYIDPAGASGTALQALLDAKAAGTTEEIQIAYGGESSTLVADVLVSDIEFPKPYDDRQTVSITLEVDGEPTDTFNNVDTGLDALITAFFASTPSTVAGIFETATSGATKFTGNVYATSIEISIPFDGAITVTGQAEGTGALTQGTTT